MNDASTIDVAIIGAGIAGVAAGALFSEARPDLDLVLFERRQKIGGTWDLFRYPGIRSDSDMFTLGFSFRPWKSDVAIAQGGDIRNYVEETARDYGLIEKIRFGRKIVAVDWSSEERRWALHWEAEDGGESGIAHARFVYFAAGYYDYDAGFRPHFAGEEDFSGHIVHPQSWPEDLDWSGKKVVVIGSGATAITLVPAMTEKADKVTMLQRSPTYIAELPSRDRLYRWLNAVMPRRWAYRIVRKRNILLSRFFYTRARKYPDMARANLDKRLRKRVGDAVDVDRHFTPRYNPWDERLCLVPDGDLFEALVDGSADVVTGEIDRFDTSGIALKDGGHVDADIVVSATGLNLALFGKTEIRIDGSPIDPAERLPYKGLMLSGTPNLFFVFGYTNASWTLKAELVARYAIRVVNAVDAKGAAFVEPPLPDSEMALAPMFDFTSGYFKRAEHLLPKQGTEGPWTVKQDYRFDRERLLKAPVDDGVLRFG